ncbi:hypothetical protein [Eubacterium xylanophilum]|uniref:hypothetical protein n=1 Tax=Eubacterium xylanophilum TaxID=39497 RepID=UPI00047D3CE6|nr:hypothetical protein [Eubacterium xylanophilum]
MKKKLVIIGMMVVMMLEVVGTVPATPINEHSNVVEAKKRTKKKKAKKVYITPTGKCYHSRKCGRGSYYKVTLKKAKSYLLKPCKKCYR